MAEACQARSRVRAIGGARRRRRRAASSALCSSVRRVWKTKCAMIETTLTRSHAQETRRSARDIHMSTKLEVMRTSKEYSGNKLLGHCQHTGLSSKSGLLEPPNSILFGVPESV